MKILYCNAPRNKFDQLITEGLTDLGHQVAAVNNTTPGPHVQRAAAECDVALSAWADQALIALAGQMKPKRLVTYLRSYEAFAPPLMNAVNWDQVDHVIYVADHVLEYVHTTYPKLAQIPCSVVHNGIKLGTYSTEKDDGAETRVLVLANLSHKKGLGLLAQAAAMLTHKDYEVHVAGEWQEERFRQYYSAPGIRRLLAQVKFLGPQDIDRDFFKPYGWILSTSPWEGCPWNVIEAMSAGCIPLVHGWPGAETLFGSGAVWHSLSELVELLGATHIMPATEAVQRIAERSRNARLLIETKYTAEQMVRGIEQALLQAVDSPRVAFSILGDRNHASSRIRGWWVIDQLQEREGCRVIPIRAYEPNNASAEAHVISRAWGPAAMQKINSWLAKGCMVIYDAADFYEEAVDTINLCHVLITPTQELAKKYAAAGVTAACHVIPDMHDPVIEFMDVDPDPAPEVAYFGTEGTLDNVNLVTVPEALTPVIYGPRLVYPDGEQRKTYNGWTLRPWVAGEILSELNSSAVVVLPCAEGQKSYKSANKLLTAAVAGAPVVCGPRPAYVEIMRSAGLERYVAESSEAWTSLVAEVAAFTPDERRNFVEKLRIAIKPYSPGSIAKQWEGVLSFK